MQTGGTAVALSPFCRRASRNRAVGANTDGMDVCLLSRMGGMTIFDLPRTRVEEKAMQSESRQAHWQNVYARKGENEVSWFQENPAPSLELIAQAGATSASAIIDI